MVGMQLNRRYTQTMVCLTIGVILLYIPLNIMYVVMTAKTKGMDSVPRDSGHIKGKVDLTMPLALKDIIPQNDGSVDLLLRLDMQQFMRYIDPTASKNPGGEATANPLPRKIKFLINNPKVCEGVPDLKWIIYVHSAPKNIKRREILRNTWASKTLFKKEMTRVVFLMGSPEDSKDKLAIEEESKKYEDIIMGDFLDSYHNLTMKGIMGLKWVSTYCPQAAFAIKADDDAFVNVFKILQVVQPIQDKKRLVVCPLWKPNTMPILRDPKKCMKWCVKFNEFPGLTHFPKYCAGLSFMISRELIPEMFNISTRTPFFWIDDVYVTGILMSKMKNIEYVDLLKNFTLKETLAIDQYKSKDQPSYMFVHAKKPDNFMTLWNATLHKLSTSDLGLLGESVFNHYPELKEKLTNLAP